MRSTRAVLAIVAIGIGSVTLLPMLRSKRSARVPPASLTLVTQSISPKPARFDPEESAAAFIGVRSYASRGITEVRHAADDAVDLAFQFAFERRMTRISPKRMIIGLSGTPDKDESKRRLERLINAGAIVRRRVRAEEIPKLVEQQAALAGREGLLVVSIASHGFTHKGASYVLGSKSRAYDPATAVPLTEIVDAAGGAARSLVFVDACRDRIDATQRTASADPRTAAPLLGRMSRVQGQAVLFAAPNGGYAYGGDGNGVFTKAILDGLQCQATAVREAVTIDSLANFVNKRVKESIANEHPELQIEGAIQTLIDGDMGNMPLVNCAPPPPPPPHLARTLADGTTIIAYGKNDQELWRRDIGTNIVANPVADLDGDLANEAIVGTRGGLMVLTHENQVRWSRDQPIPLRAIHVHAVGKKMIPKVIAHFEDETRWRLAFFDALGGETHVEHPGRLRAVEFDRPTHLHGWRIIGATAQAVFVIESENLGKPKWLNTLSGSDEIRNLIVRDDDNDSRRDIVLTTNGGHTFVLDFAGKVLDRRRADTALAGIDLIPQRPPRSRKRK